MTSSPRPRSSLLALVLALAAALPGAAVFAQTPAPPANCLEVRTESLPQAVLQADLILLGVAGEGPAAGSRTILPQAFLKGAASSSAIHLLPPGEANPSCPPATLEPGARILAFLNTTNGLAESPGSGRVFLLSGGRAVGLGGDFSESDLVEKIRALTHQYAVPAASQSEGAGIDWGKTVLPLSAALLIVFGIGLVLMRVWHRIDPS